MGVSGAVFWGTKSLHIMKGEGEDHMALAAGMLSWAVPRALGYPENSSLCFPFLKRSYILLLDVKGFFLKAHH